MYLYLQHVYFLHTIAGSSLLYTSVDPQLNISYLHLGLHLSLHDVQVLVLRLSIASFLPKKFLRRLCFSLVILAARMTTSYVSNLQQTCFTNYDDLQKRYLL